MQSRDNFWRLRLRASLFGDSGSDTGFGQNVPAPGAPAKAPKQGRARLMVHESNLTRLWFNESSQSCVGSENQEYESSHSSITLIVIWARVESTACGYLLGPSLVNDCHRRLVRNRQTLFVRIVFFYWKTTWGCLARGVFSIGYRGFRHLDTLLDGSNDFDETLIEYGPGLHLSGGMGNYPRKIQLEKAQRKNALSMLKPIGFFGRSFNWTFLKIRSNDLLHFSL